VGCTIIQDTTAINTKFLYNKDLECSFTIISELRTVHWTTLLPRYMLIADYLYHAFAVPRIKVINNRISGHRVWAGPQAVT